MSAGLPGPTPLLRAGLAAPLATGGGFRGLRGLLAAGAVDPEGGEGVARVSPGSRVFVHQGRTPSAPGCVRGAADLSGKFSWQVLHFR